MRKEFFKVSVDELESLVTGIEPTAEFNRTMLAEEFRQSLSMAIFKNSDNNQIILTCSCGCNDGLRVQIENDDETYCYQTYLSGNWYKEQGHFLDKLRKIWRIIINKDYYYSEICLTKRDWEEYNKWVNAH